MLSTIQIYSQRFFQEAILMTIKQPSKPGKSVNSNAGVASVNELNTYFTNAISYAGYIVVALGIISLILAFAESSMNSKARGSMLVAGGAIMVSFAAVMDKLRSGTDSTGASVAKKTLTMIGTGMTLVGGILLAYSVIQYIMAFIHSTADESANASKGLAVGIAFSCGGGIMKGLKGILASNSHGTTRIVKYVVYQVIANAATYVGVGMILYGIINYLLAYRDENVESKMKASIYFAIGLGLTSARVIIHSVTKLGYYK